MPAAALWRCHHVHKKAGEYALKDRNSPAWPRCERQARCQAWVSAVAPQEDDSAKQGSHNGVPRWTILAWIILHERTQVDDLSGPGLQPLARVGEQDPRRCRRPEARVRGRPGAGRRGLRLRLPSRRRALGPRLAGARAHGVPLPQARLRRPHRRGHGAGRQRRPRPRGAERGRAVRNRACVAGGRRGQAAIDRYLPAAHPAARPSAGRRVRASPRATG